MAAERLFADRGIEQVSMESIARAAGVGKGTLYRRFGDRGGVALALLDEHERRLQEAVVRGRSPLGPGAAPLVRLQAFLDALVALVERHTDLIVASETANAGRRFGSPVYGAWHQHVRLLLEQAAPHVDADLYAHALLSLAGGELYRHLRRDRRIARRRITAALEALASAASR